MPYIKNIASIVNGADACGGGMKKAGLVYGSDWGRVTHGNGANGGHGITILKKNTPTNIMFTLYGQAKKTCCSERVRGVSSYTTVRRTLLNN